MKKIIWAIVLMIAATACKKVLVTDQDSRANSEQAPENSAPPPQWYSVGVPTMTTYPFNNPDFHNLMIPCANTVYCLMSDLYDVHYKLDTTTLIWSEVTSNNSSFSVFSVGYQYMFSYKSKIYYGMMPGGSEYNETAFGAFNPATGATYNLANFPGTAVTDACFYVYGDKGYLVSGKDMHSQTTVNQFWEYNFATDQWTDKGSSPVGVRAGASAFVAGTKVYIGFGYNYASFNGTIVKLYKDDWLQYTPASGVTVAKADFTANNRASVKGFVVNGTVYLGFGYSGVTNYTDFWKYDPVLNVWIQKNNWPGVAGPENTIHSVAFGNKGFVVKGALNSFWRFFENGE